MIAKLFEIRKTVGKGLGLFAKNSVPKGTVVCIECGKCKEFSAKEVMRMPKARKEHFLTYAYSTGNGSFIMPCDETKFLNHSCNANILDSGKGFDVVVSDIRKGEEATYDYRLFPEDGPGMACRCGEANCCGTVRGEQPPPPELRRFWKKKVDSALRRITKVKQPFRQVRPEEFQLFGKIP